MNSVPTLAFHFAIQFPDGLWYYGPTWSGTGKQAKRWSAPENRGPVSHTYTYTEDGARRSILAGGRAFEGCTVVRVLD